MPLLEMEAAGLKHQEVPQLLNGTGLLQLATPCLVMLSVLTS